MEKSPVLRFGIVVKEAVHDCRPQMSSKEVNFSCKIKRNASVVVRYLKQLTLHHQAQIRNGISPDAETAARSCIVRKTVMTRNNAIWK